MGVCGQCGAELPAGAKFCSACGAAVEAAPPSREQRKTVTVLFCDIAGSTALGEATDPEALRVALARYFDRMKGIVERHGGTVEKFIGDAVMAVFGVPVVHEDDAIRACRAALEMRDALPELGLRGRIGVNTGEVVAGTVERLATGDAVNVAARLEQAAAPGEVLVGAGTRATARDAIAVGVERRLDLKGKAEPVAAYALEAVVGEAPGRRADVVTVGRERERRTLEDAWSRAATERACHLFTVLGAAGVGKSRLVSDFVAGLDAPVAVGRCLSYGDGITYSPIVQIVTSLGRRPADPRAAAALESLLGESDEAFAADEIAWAFRTLLEEGAPIVCVFDDLHWAEPTLLDLIDLVADWSRDAPILLLCMARPELLDRRPTWGGGKLNATTVLLEPLGAEEAEKLIDLLVPDGVEDALRERIRSAAAGNPLFLEEMVRVVAEADGGDIDVPPTIQALLAARLDQLEPAERSVLDRGAVEGQVFHRGGVAALDPADTDLMPRLMRLVRKELVRPDRGSVPGDDAFRFRHLLIRDAAYDALPKATRAELHERFADWLAQRAADIVEYDEIAGYHLEQAARFRRELGMDDERTAELARRAGERLGVAGERAFARRDMGAASTLLRRSVEAAPEDALERELALVEALAESGALEAALARADAVVSRGRATADRRTELRGALARARFAMLAEGGSVTASLRAAAEEAIPVFEAAGDDRGLVSAWLAIALSEHFSCHMAAAGAAIARAVEYAERAGAPAIASGTTLWRAAGLAHGPVPVDEAIAWYEAHPDEARAVPVVQSFWGSVEAMRGNFEHARELVQGGRQRARDLGQGLLAAGSSMHEAFVELLAGDPAAAAEVAVAGERELRAAGEHGWRSSVAGFAAEAFYELGRDDDAWRYTEIAEEAAAPDDIVTQVQIRYLRALLLARRGELVEAARHAREATQLVDGTDMAHLAANAWISSGTVARAAGREDEATRAFAHAAELYERKGDVVGLRRVRALQT